MRILVEQLNGETLDLEVTAETTMRAVKEQLKVMRKWGDELSHGATVVEVIMGDKKVMNEETLEGLRVQRSPWCSRRTWFNASMREVSAQTLTRTLWSWWKSRIRRAVGPKS